MKNIFGTSHCLVGILLLALGAAGQVNAAGCTVSSSGLVFGSYQPLNSVGKLRSDPSTSSAIVSVICSGIVNGGAYRIALGPSMSGSGDRISTRYLTSARGGDGMAFNVYREASYSTVWGDGIVAGSPLGAALPPGNSSQSHTVNGRIPAGQSSLRAGNYFGSLTLTLSYQS